VLGPQPNFPLRLDLRQQLGPLKTLLHRQL
jgi:hypothetical protein